MDWFCPSCGEQNGGSKFCVKCGAQSLQTGSGAKPGSLSPEDMAETLMRLLDERAPKCYLHPNRPAVQTCGGPPIYDLFKYSDPSCCICLCPKDILGKPGRCEGDTDYTSCTRQLCAECVDKGRHHHSDKREHNVTQLITHGVDDLNANGVAIETRSITKTYCQSCKQGAVDLNFEKTRREGVACKRAGTVCMMVLFVVLCIAGVLLYIYWYYPSRPIHDEEHCSAGQFHKWANTMCKCKPGTGNPGDCDSLGDDEVYPCGDRRWMSKQCKA